SITKPSCIRGSLRRVRSRQHQILPALLLVALASCRRPDEDGALKLAGTLEARDIRVGSLVGGRVARVLVDEGDRVVPGQPLVELERDLPALQVEEQRARVAEAEAHVQL